MLTIISKMWWTLRDLQHFYSRAAPSKYLFTNTLLQTLNKFLVILFRKTRRVVDAQNHKKSYTFTISFWDSLKKVWKKYDGHSW